MAKAKTQVAPEKAGDNSNTQLALFGGPVQAGSVLDKALHREHIQKPAEKYKDKAGKVRTRGEVDKTVFRIKPRVSSKNPDNLKSVFDCTGQELMGFEAVARKELSDAFIRNMASRVATGEIALNRGVINNRTGNESYSFKRVGIRVVRTITPQQAMEVLGLTESDLQALQGLGDEHKEAA